MAIKPLDIQKREALIDTNRKKRLDDLEKEIDKILDGYERNHPEELKHMFVLAKQEASIDDFHQVIKRYNEWWDTKVEFEGNAVIFTFRVKYK